MKSAKKGTVFVCKNCGNESAKWMGQCGGCGEWNTMVEAPRLGEKGGNSEARRVEVVKLGEVARERLARERTGIGELDMVLGGGWVAGQAVLVAGEPGIGKSTLLLQVALKYRGGVVYVCGEESAGQVALRAGRLGGSVGMQEVGLLEQTDVDEVVSVCRQKVKEDLGLVVVDSIQTMRSAEMPGMAGSVGQVKECTLRLVKMAKETGVAVIIVGHVTKEGDIAGPRILEHMVDTVVWFEGERSQSLRMVRTIKNRFGRTDEVGVFRMEERGLVEVDNPSEYLLAERVKNVSGSVVGVVVEGSRPILVEVQALTVATQLPVPRRVATGVDYNRLQMLVAVLTRRVGLELGGMDVYVNVAGGVRVSDPGLDLALCLAIASAYRDKPVSDKVAAVGEVGLMGEVRKVGDLDRRVKEAKKLGYGVASAESGRAVGAAITKLVG